jgi:hypothetical protein
VSLFTEFFIFSQSLSPSKMSDLAVITASTVVISARDADFESDVPSIMAHGYWCAVIFPLIASTNFFIVYLTPGQRCQII